MDKTLLVVDDDPAILDAIEFVLCAEGYDVQATDKTYHLLRLEEQDILPDIIILDMLLSGEDGRTLCKALKSSERTKDIPVLMISAHPDAERSVREAGADDFLAKPFEIDDLIQKVKKYTNQ